MTGSGAPLLDLLERCGVGDPAAWSEFRHRFAGLATFVLGRFGNLTPLEREDAEDAARVAVSLEIVAGRIKATSDGGVVAFLRAVITNAARDVWRRRHPSEPLPSSLRDGRPSPFEQTWWHAQLERAEGVLLAWSAENRFIFLMKLEHVSTATIKVDLERLFGVVLSPEAVDVRFFRLREGLRRHCGGSRHDG